MFKEQDNSMLVKMEILTKLNIREMASELAHCCWALAIKSWQLAQGNV